MDFSERRARTGLRPAVMFGVLLRWDRLARLSTDVPKKIRLWFFRVEKIS
jgi:hypothetical protein